MHFCYVAENCISVKRFEKANMKVKYFGILTAGVLNSFDQFI